MANTILPGTVKVLAASSCLTVLEQLWDAAAPGCPATGTADSYPAQKATVLRGCQPEEHSEDAVFHRLTSGTHGRDQCVCDTHTHVMHHLCNCSVVHC